MSSKITGIEERLTSLSDQELRERLRDAENAFTDAIESRGSTYRLEVKTTSGATVEVRSRDVIGSITEHAFSKLKGKYSQKAIDEFMEKVDSLQEQIEELQNF